MTMLPQPLPRHPITVVHPAIQALLDAMTPRQRRIAKSFEYQMYQDAALMSVRTGMSQEVIEAELPAMQDGDLIALHADGKSWRVTSTGNTIVRLLTQD